MPAKAHPNAITRRDPAGRLIVEDAPAYPTHRYKHINWEPPHSRRAILAGHGETGCFSVNASDWSIRGESKIVLRNFKTHYFLTHDEAQECYDRIGAIPAPRDLRETS